VVASSSEFQAVREDVSQLKKQLATVMQDCDITRADVLMLQQELTAQRQLVDDANATVCSLSSFPGGTEERGKGEGECQLVFFSKKRMWVQLRC
jgi:hypothetical protein